MNPIQISLWALAATCVAAATLFIVVAVCAIVNTIRNLRAPPEYEEEKVAEAEAPESLTLYNSKEPVDPIDW